MKIRNSLLLFAAVVFCLKVGAAFKFVESRDFRTLRAVLPFSEPYEIRASTTRQETPDITFLRDKTEMELLSQEDRTIVLSAAAIAVACLLRKDR